MGSIAPAGIERCSLGFEDVHGNRDQSHLLVLKVFSGQLDAFRDAVDQSHLLVLKVGIRTQALPE